MASDALEASAADASVVDSNEEEVQGKLAACCLSSSTDRAELWRANGITFRPYRDERDMVALGAMVDRDLSEPYSMFTYRVFIQTCPSISHLCFCNDEMIGCVVCKLENHKKLPRGYIGMLSVNPAFRRMGIGRHLVALAVDSIRAAGSLEAVLEAEASNTKAIALYESLGFFRDKRLEKYYLNGGDAYRLKKWFPDLDYSVLYNQL